MKDQRYVTRARRQYRECAPNIDPIFKTLHSLLRPKAGHVNDICHQAGVDPKTLRRWFRRGSPAVASLTAVLNTIGYTLTIRKSDDRDPE